MSAPDPDFDAAFRADFTTLLRWRRDVRRFRTDPLPDGLVDRLIDLAGLSPSVGLSEPWRFVHVADPGRRAAIAAAFAACNAAALAAEPPDRAPAYARLKLAGLAEAPCHLAVFADPTTEQGHGLGRRTQPETLVYSAVMAIHTFWLAARAWGLGVGWVSILDPHAMARICDVPDGWIFVGYLCVGRPERASDVPELAQAGWAERGDPHSARALRR